MAYERTTWNTGDPITERRMNNIEEGILAVETTAEAASSRALEAKTVNDT